MLCWWFLTTLSKHKRQKLHVKHKAINFSGRIRTWSVLIGEESTAIFTQYLRQETHIFWWYGVTSLSAVARQVKQMSVSDFVWRKHMSSFLRPFRKHHFNRKKWWECSLPHSDEGIHGALSCLSYKHILTSVLGFSVFQQTCCALFNVKKSLMQGYNIAKYL